MYAPGRASGDSMRVGYSKLIVAAVLLLSSVSFCRAGESSVALRELEAGAGGVKAEVPVPKSVAVPQGLPAYMDGMLDDVASYDMVVISICGLKPEYIKAALTDYVRNAARHQLAVVSSAVQDILDGNKAAGDDAYLDRAVRAMAAKSGRRILIIPFRWSRNPSTTARTESHFSVWLPKVYAAAAAHKKPLYIVSHSWGTMLAYDMLADMAAKGSPVRVHKLVTMGSPLVPSSWWLNAFDGMQQPSGNFAGRVKKPANVRYWVNFWAEGDSVSNSIPAADINVKVDAGAVRFKELVSQAMRDPKRLLSAQNDMKRLTSVQLWHASYFSGYTAALESIDDKVSLDIPAKMVLPVIFR